MEQKFKFSAIGLAFVAIALLSGCKSGYNRIYSNTSSSSSSSSKSSASSITSTSSSTLSSIASSSAASVDIVALGKTAYEAQCVTCHGANGTGTTAINLLDGPAELAEFIETNMPKATPETCGADCAEQIAAYINSWDDEAYTQITTANGYTIEAISNCGVDTAVASNTTAAFNANTNSIMGWSYVTTAAPYDELSMSGDSALYKVPGVTATDSTCNSVNTQKIVLVKKYADWDKQHSNGIEVSLANQNKTFSDVDKIVFDFKLNDDSVILSKTTLMAIYGDTLTTAQYDELDQGKAVLAVSILAPSTGSKIQTERYLVIDQTTLANQWIRITITFDEMDIFTGEVWEKVATTFAAQASTVADRIQINPEVLGTKTTNTTYGDVIRNLKGGPDDPDWAAMNIPERFKELSITLKNLEIHWK